MEELRAKVDRLIHGTEELHSQYWPLSGMICDACEQGGEKLNQSRYGTFHGVRFGELLVCIWRADRDDGRGGFEVDDYEIRLMVIYGDSLGEEYNMFVYYAHRQSYAVEKGRRLYCFYSNDTLRECGLTFDVVFHFKEMFYVFKNLDASPDVTGEEYKKCWVLQ